MFVNPVPRTVSADPAWAAPAGRAHPVHPLARQLPGLLAPAECAQLAALLHQVPWQPVSVTGMSGNYTPGDPVGSWRASLFDEGYAAALFARLRPALAPRLVLDPTTGTEQECTTAWRPVGVNPLLRLVRYDAGGWLVPHYDAPYVAGPDTRSLLSLVAYVHRDPGVRGGATRFLRDAAAAVPVEARDLSDRAAMVVREPDVAWAVTGAPGDALAFPHRLLHDGQLVTGGTKLIVRTDVMYTRVR